MKSMAQGSTSDSPNKIFPRFTRQFVVDVSLKMKALYAYLIHIHLCSEEQHNSSIMTNTREQLNIDFSIISISPGGRKPDRVIENENKIYIIDIIVTVDCQENMSNAKKNRK